MLVLVYFTLQQKYRGLCISWEKHVSLSHYVLILKFWVPKYQKKLSLYMHISLLSCIVLTVVSPKATTKNLGCHRSTDSSNQAMPLKDNITLKVQNQLFVKLLMNAQILLAILLITIVSEPNLSATCIFIPGFCQWLMPILNLDHTLSKEK